MVKYMDKLIGQLITKIHQLGIINNTIIILTADNGTPQAITSLYNGDTIIGGKGLTTEYGTHVPLIVGWKDHTPVGIDSSLIDFSDILPTLSDIGKADTSSYGTLDGTSFYHNIIGTTGINRDWIFCHFDAHPEDENRRHRLTRWVQNKTYKKYDTVASPQWREGKFINFSIDFYEPTTTIVGANKTKEEKQLNNSFTKILSELK